MPATFTPYADTYEVLNSERQVVGEVQFGTERDLMSWIDATLRQGTFDFRLKGCTCPESPSGPWDCFDCPTCGEAAQRAADEEQRYEIEAEEGYVRYLENQGWDDDPRGF